ncbi:hypothetical protein KAR91_14015 [Candidatus Pacearchaeota archaeon]|nr:hypothetical protein [Candidatus Pacearchaeota archaeon]
MSEASEVKESERLHNILSKGNDVVCPDCQCLVFPDGGCFYCPVCGWSKCQ